MPVWLIVITVFYVALSLSPDEVGMTLAPHLDLSQFVFVLLPEIIKLGLVLHVIYMTTAGSENDLVDARRRIRKPLSIGAAGLAALVIVVEICAGKEMPIIIEAVGSVLMFGLALVANVALLELRIDFTSMLKKPPDVTNDGGESTMAASVVSLMSEQRFYANTVLRWQISQIICSCQSIGSVR